MADTDQAGRAPSQRTAAYAQAFHSIISVEDDLNEVEDELFRFARVLEGNDELLSTLADPHLEPARRQQIVTDLLEGRAQPTTVGLIGLVIGNGRARDLATIVDALVAVRAGLREKAVAQVRSSIALSDEQVARLADALGSATGKDVEVKVIVDHTVQGGIVAQIGDTVIDGSVRRRLEQLRAAL